MNETNPTPEDELAPLDPSEQQWVDQLAQREPDLMQSEQAFVQSVMRRYSQEDTGPAVVGRIGKGVLPYAVAAAVLLAAFVGWITLIGGTGQATDGPSVVEESADPTQPDGPPMVVNPDRPKVELGKLIAQVKTTATDPASTLTTAVSEVPDTLSVDRLFELLGDSVPDLQEILAPLDQKNEQSRA